MIAQPICKYKVKMERFSSRIIHLRRIFAGRPLCGRTVCFTAGQNGRRRSNFTITPHFTHELTKYLQNIFDICASVQILELFFGEMLN